MSVAHRRLILQTHSTLTCPKQQPPHTHWSFICKPWELHKAPKTCRCRPRGAVGQDNTSGSTSELLCLFQTDHLPTSTQLDNVSSMALIQPCPMALFSLLMTALVKLLVPTLHMAAAPVILLHLRLTLVSFKTVGWGESLKQMQVY